MNLKSMLAVSILVFPISSFGLGPVNPLDHIVVKSEQFKGVNYLLEQGLGRPLTAVEKTQLARVSEQENLIIQASNHPREKTYALYCVGLTGAVVGKISGALCASLQTLTTYRLGFIGLGEAFQLEGNVLRLAITFDASDYDEKFDPIPGSYVLGTAGLTLLGGGTGFRGTAGNKSLAGLGLNIGLGLDLGTIAGLYIQ